MKTLIVTITFVLCTLTVFSQDVTKPAKSDTLTTIGMIHKKPFIDKMGREYPDNMYYWFKTDKDDYFIKLYESKVISDSLNNYTGKLIKLKYIIKNGEWDSNGKELIPVQSRVGQYIVVLKINED